MTLRTNSQQEKIVKGQCASQIVEIERFTNQKIFRFLGQIGVKYATLSRAKNGKAGSEPLLACLKLLLEVEKQRRELNEIRIREGELLKRLGAQAMNYPEHRAGKHFEMNEVNLGKTGSATVMAVSQEPLVIREQRAGKRHRASAKSGRQKTRSD